MLVTRAQLIRCAPLATCVVASCLIAVFVMRLWRAHLGVPFQYESDSFPHALNTWQVAHNGWFWTDNRLAYPFSQHFQDWPLPDVMGLLTAGFFGLFTDRWPVIVNATFLSTFPLIAASSWWVLRKIGVSPWVAVVVALLYDFLPFHFFRGEIHLFLSGYYAVPLGIFLAWSVLSGESLFGTRLVVARTVALAVLVGATDTYFAAFSVISIVGAVLVRLVSERQWRVAGAGAAVVVLLIATVGLAGSGALLYHHSHGPNEASAHRAASDSELFGLKLADMLLPVTNHRVPVMADARERYATEFGSNTESGSAALGLVGSFGLLWLFGVCLVSLSRWRAKGVDQRQRDLSILVLVAFVTSTLGGLATMIALYVTPNIRAWDRMSIFIGFSSLAAVGLLLDRLLERRSVMWKAVPIVVLVGGVLDQTAARPFDYDKAAQAYLSDRAFFGQIERTLPADAAVFQLPIMRFPEGDAIKGVQNYEPLRPYLTSNELRWSFGGIRNRIESEWQQRIDTTRADVMLDQIRAVGFSGLYIDRNGYESRALEDRVRSLTGVAPLEAQNGRGVFFDLRNYPVKLELRNALLQPVYVNEYWKGFYHPETNGSQTWRWAKQWSADVVITNGDMKSAHEATMSFAIEPNTSAVQHFTVHWPDGYAEPVTTTGTLVHLTRQLAFAPRDNHVRIESDAQAQVTADDKRKLYFQVVDVEVTGGQ